MRNRILVLYMLFLLLVSACTTGPGFITNPDLSLIIDSVLLLEVDSLETIPSEEYQEENYRTVHLQFTVKNLTPISEATLFIDKFELFAGQDFEEMELVGPIKAYLNNGTTNSIQSSLCLSGDKEESISIHFQVEKESRIFALSYGRKLFLDFFKIPRDERKQYEDTKGSIITNQNIFDSSQILNYEILQRMIIESNFNLESKNLDNYDILEFAILKGNFSVVSGLITNHSFDLERSIETEHYGRTDLLGLAILSQKLEILEFLLSYGLSFSVREPGNYSYLDLAITTGSSRIINFVSSFLN